MRPFEPLARASSFFPILLRQSDGKTAAVQDFLMTFLETVCSRSAPLPSTPLSCSGSLTGGKQRPLVQFLLSCSGSLTGEIRAPHIGIGSKPMSGRCSGAMAMECVSVKIETSLGYVMFFLLHKLISEIEIQS